MYGNIDREAAIQYVAMSSSCSPCLSCSSSFSCAYYAAEVKKEAPRRTAKRGRKMDRATFTTTIQRQQERDNRKRCAGPVPTRFFPSSVPSLPDVIELGGKLCRERGLPPRRTRKKEETRKGGGGGKNISRSSGKA